MPPSFQNPQVPLKNSEDKEPATATEGMGATANPGYALQQLAAALATSQEHADPATRQRAKKKAENWVQVFEGMLSGRLRVGSRTPVSDVPAWATLEVVQGGFATGTLLAEGPLQPHEEALLARIAPSVHPLPGSPAPVRATLNRYYLSDAGIAELQGLLQSGRYRVTVPEEGTLLVIAWLLKHGHADPTRELLEEIAPYLDRLRFYPVYPVYPVPHDPPQGDDSVRVRLQTIGQTITDLKAIRVPVAYQKQREAVLVWAPLLDRAVQLFLETVEGPVPFLQTGPDGKPTRNGANGNFIVQGSWPCQQYPDSWQARAQTLLDDYRTLRKKHPLCRKPERADSNFAILRSALERCVRNPKALTGRDVARIRRVLAHIIARRGAPSSPQCRELRQKQAAKANLPTNAELAQVVVDRLAKRGQDGGLDGFDQFREVLLPVTDAEAASHPPVTAGQAVAERLAEKVRRCMEASPEILVEQGIITSGEVLARVIPQITAQVSAAPFPDEELRVLYGAIYQAFRRRRSLLLLNLESQVKLTELPWIKAISPYQKRDGRSEEQARQTLEKTATLAVTAFPQQILPNKLLQEFRALSQAAGMTVATEEASYPLPFVDEVAADIFMGAFSLKFLRAAKIAGQLLEGTLYERYYGLSYARVEEINGVSPIQTHQTQQKQLPWLSGQSGQPMVQTESAADSPAFFQLCSELAGREQGKSSGAGSGSWIARNGMIIEQEQILTTHNLAVLFTAVGLNETLAPRRTELARRCFTWICRRHRHVPANWKARLQMVKKSAYAWRQMVFFLALEPDAEMEAFLHWTSEHLEQQPEPFRTRLKPALVGLERALRRLPPEELSANASGQTVVPRFLGWTTGKHWLLS